MIVNNKVVRIGTLEFNILDLQNEIWTNYSFHWKKMFGFILVCKVNAKYFYGG